MCFSYLFVTRYTHDLQDKIFTHRDDYQSEGPSHSAKRSSFTPKNISKPAFGYRVWSFLMSIVCAVLFSRLVVRFWDDWRRFNKIYFLNLLHQIAGLFFS